MFTIISSYTHALLYSVPVRLKAWPVYLSLPGLPVNLWPCDINHQGPIRRTRRRAAQQHSLVTPPTHTEDTSVPSTTTARRGRRPVVRQTPPPVPSTLSSSALSTNNNISIPELAAELFQYMRQAGFTIQSPAVQTVPAEIPSASGSADCPPVDSTLFLRPATTNATPSVSGGGLNQSHMLQQQHMSFNETTHYSRPPLQGQDNVPSYVNVLNSVSGGLFSPAGPLHGHRSNANTSPTHATLTDTIHSLLLHATSPATSRTYSRAYNLLCQFVRSTFIGTPVLPTTYNTLAFFIAHLYRQNLASSTISTYVAAISYINKIAGYADPSQSFLIKKLLSSVQRGNYQVDNRLPITPEILTKLVTSLQYTTQSPYQYHLLKAMYLLAFHAFLRVGEMTLNKAVSNVLQFEDLQLIKDSSGFLCRLELTFRSFKGHYNIRPITLSIAASRQPAVTCPVSALQQYLQNRGQQPGPLFCFPPAKAVPYAYFSECLKHSLSWAGLSHHRFTTHSFRIGAASSAASRGIPDDEIQQMGRWQSMAFKRYIRLPSLFDT
ncbi:uncharacterized protein LOC110454687 isoform X2 [Mizuhopecten yessoensis]|uniref:uncharacterized protein LOC110446311 isoform X2 n=1 Tax=Mizuhopecten yessoensis TaxID=6573 RepID=UPI000B45E4FB|nr:uncharacterized protein LOC110446311 isoform X2 [Mizuhopecten yessoensis]XP_021360013.1 uncharacterized protein LOC110454687 isoform X2 [Mizuhopecten yessoensis]